MLGKYHMDIVYYNNNPSVWKMSITILNLTNGQCLLRTSLRNLVAQLIEALRYSPEGQWFDSRWRHWNFSLTMAVGLTQPLTEISMRNISWGVKAAGV
jgi:hypothetical protein